jgi:hypothetical protein
MALAGALWEISALETLFGVPPHARAAGRLPDRRLGTATAAGAVLGTLLLGWAMDEIGVDTSLALCAAALLTFAAIAQLAQRRSPRRLASDAA